MISTLALAAFLKERLQPFKASRPDLSHSEVMKELGKIWKSSTTSTINDQLDETLVQLRAITLSGAKRPYRPGELSHGPVIRSAQKAAR
ncbi:uncharacterized protein EI90DRAFT_3028139 [Cantharellus anzutake]|uniref:uncharacterized protein n=1 Tax=Cantharellus anzutake TaxID=1750568 RepID=UPI0019054A95|nr:uncharacterized protein EI90DRAFT_3028139 [Cantharellus anzutake]KAF8344060.1 hypothetical protein EI90DRAFT_3028139 [Cantharellus anzutake]